MNYSQQLINNILQYNKNPTSVVQVTFDMLETVLEGDNIVDATSAFTLLTEANATGVAAAIVAGEALTLPLYPEQALTRGDLYRHMSVKEFENIFALPATGEVRLLLPMDTLLNVAHSVSAELRLITLPVDTTITVNGVNLGLLYPVRIEILDNDIVQVFYDLSISNFTEQVVSNVLKSRTVSLADIPYLEIDVPVKQFTSISEIYILNSLGSFNEAIRLTDFFYTCNVYVDRGNNRWEPINTTHSTTVYDPQTPTAILEVLDDTLYVTIPEIYRTLDLLGDAIRVDVFTTQGEVSINLDEQAADKFSMVWQSNDSYYDYTETDPLNNVNDILIYGHVNVYGGRSALSADALRNEIIYRTSSGPAPLRETDLNVTFAEKGYQIVKERDTVLDRTYVAYKTLPLREATYGKSALLTLVIDTAHTPVAYANSLTLTGQRLILKSNALYKTTNGTTELVTDDAINALHSLTVTELTATLNEGKYYYSPFYYITEYRSGVTDTQVYYLDGPTVSGREFKSSNSIYPVTATDITIDLVGNQFTLTLVASTPFDTTINLDVQLKLVIGSLDSVYYLTGASLRDDFTTTYTFVLETSFDINRKHQLGILNLLNATHTPTPVYVDLDFTFDLYYLGNTELSIPVIFEDDIVHTAYTHPVFGLTHERITLSLGEHLSHLYSPSEAVVVDQQYQVYLEDVVATYPETIYQSGQFGDDYTTSSDGHIEFIALHNKGDVIYNNGEPVLQHKAGDPILDAVGNRVPISDTGFELAQRISVLGIDALYLFATHPDSVGYRDKLPSFILDFIRHEVKPTADNLSERTALRYSPKPLAKEVWVSVGDGSLSLVPSGLYFDVTFYVTQLGIKNDQVLALLTQGAKKILGQAVEKTTVAHADLITELNQLNNTYVKGVTLENPFFDQPAIMTLQAFTSAFYIPDQLTIESDGSLKVTDTISVKFKLYT